MLWPARLSLLLQVEEELKPIAARRQAGHGCAGSDGRPCEALL